jgi:hypothetical protein
MTDFLALIEELGGGLQAAIVVFLGVFAWRLYARIGDLQDARLEDAKAAAAQSAERDLEITQIMRALEEAVRGNSQQMLELRHQVERLRGSQNV